MGLRSPVPVLTATSPTAIALGGLLLASNPNPVLRLITCDPETPINQGHYEGNWVVWADQMVS